MIQINQYPIPKNNWCYSFDSELKKSRGVCCSGFETRLTIARGKVTDIPVKNLVIKAVNNMAEDNKITNIRFENKSGVLLHPNYWLEGVDYEYKNVNESKDINYD